MVADGEDATCVPSAIARTPALQARALTETLDLIDASSSALRRRGVEDGLATLAARVGMAAVNDAANAWFDDPAPGLNAHPTRAIDKPRELSATLG